MTKRNIIWVLGIASAFLLAGYYYVSHTGAYATFSGSDGVTVKRIFVPAPWDEIESNDFLAMDKVPNGVYEVQRSGNDAYAFVLLQTSGGSTFTLQSPTATKVGHTINLTATHIQLDPDQPLCCLELYAFKFKIPNVPQGELKVIFNN